MAIMIASSRFLGCLYAFIFGYARLGFKNQTKKVYSIIPIPFFPILGLLTVLVVFWLLLKKGKKKIEINTENFLTRRNEGVFISNQEMPGLLNANKKNLAKKIGIAIDRDLIEHRMTANHVFFLLSKGDLDIFTNEVLEIIANKHVWIFTEQGIQSKYKTSFGKIGKTIVFNPKYLKTFGNNELTLGLIARFLSLISREGDTNLDHVFHAIPDICTISYSFPLDVHESYASVLKHQKHLCGNRGESVLQITNHEDFVEDFTPSVKLVKADTEPFFISFKEAI
jgi:hypothetical protein